MNAMPVLPSRAGPVALRFSREVFWPVRDTENGRFINSLSFPLRDNMEFYSLKGGEQFLLHYPVQGRMRERIFFAGMDESAFLTEVTSDVITAFRNRGEDGFYDSLKPLQMKRLGTLFPEATVRRQGDVWSFPLPFTWREMTAKHFLRHRPKRLVNSGLPSENHRVGETSHVLVGKYLPIAAIHFPETKIRPLALGEGTLTAPDHAPITLRGPHAIARTPNLMPANVEYGWD